jgi:hypothetical protein
MLASSHRLIATAHITPSQHPLQLRLQDAKWLATDWLLYAADGPPLCVVSDSFIHLLLIISTSCVGGGPASQRSSSSKCV